MLKTVIQNNDISRMLGQCGLRGLTTVLAYRKPSLGQLLGESSRFILAVTAR